jgi:Na+/melibiose symporter-like transporter
MKQEQPDELDQILETCLAQNTTASYDVNRDALRQALRTQEARVRRVLRTRRRGLWFLWIIGTGMAVWAGFWIAITITNGWPVIYAIAAGVCFTMFALGVGASWASLGRQAELERNFGNTLQDEVRRSLALVDYQLSVTRRRILLTLGTALIAVGTGPFSWTLTRSQDIPDSPSRGWWWYTVLLAVFFVWASYKERNEIRKAKPKLETRQRRLRELLAVLDVRE